MSILYFGSQSTFIQWIHLPQDPPSPSSVSFPPLRTPEPKSSRFFDNPPQSGTATPTTDNADSARAAGGGGRGSQDRKVPTVYGEAENSVPAHWGYVYALAWVEDPRGGGKTSLASGSGGGDVKVRFFLSLSPLSSTDVLLELLLYLYLDLGSPAGRIARARKDIWLGLDRGRPLPLVRPHDPFRGVAGRDDPGFRP